MANDQKENQHGNSATISTSQMKPADQAPVGTPGTGDNLCPECSGSGRVGQQLCQPCGGTGVVNEAVGGA